VVLKQCPQTSIHRVPTPAPSLRDWHAWEPRAPARHLVSVGPPVRLFVAASAHAPVVRHMHPISTAPPCRKSLSTRACLTTLSSHARVLPARRCTRHASLYGGRGGVVFTLYGDGVLSCEKSVRCSCDRVHRRIRNPLSHGEPHHHTPKHRAGERRWARCHEEGVWMCVYGRFGAKPQSRALGQSGFESLSTLVPLRLPPKGAALAWRLRCTATT